MSSSLFGRVTRFSGLAVLGGLLLFAAGCGEGRQSGGTTKVPYDPLVDVDWLAGRLGDPEVRVVDARSAVDQFEAGHIPGAVRLGPYELSATVDGLSGQVAPPAIADPLLLESGLRPEQTIVVYGKEPEYDAARVVWVLRYYGFPDVRYLDGGWERWDDSGLEVETGPAGPSPEGKLPETMQPDLRVTGDWILERLGEPPFADPQMQVLDVRSPGEYEAGRIPGAIHVQWTRNLVDGVLRPRPELESLYADLDKTRPTVVYCLAGWRASLAWLVLDSLGFEDVRVYDGSWIEWGEGGRFPIETDAGFTR